MVLEQMTTFFVGLVAAAVGDVILKELISTKAFGML
jgi:hypothetical protein